MEIIFRILLPVVLILFVAHRGYYVKNHSQPETQTLKQREQGLLSKVAGLLGTIGFASVLAFVMYPNVIAFADLPFPAWLRWLGVGSAIFGFFLLQWAQSTLGKSWSDTPRMMKEQILITSGPYRFIRHPIYTAFILILGSTFLLSANWLIGVAWIGMTVLDVISRMDFEERLMIEYFGDQYRDYRKKTGQLLPKIL